MRVVLIRPDRIGDCVIGSCAVNDLRRALPAAEILWAVRREVAGLFSGDNFPGKLLAYETSGDGLERALRDRKPDVVVHLSPDVFAENAALRAGVPVRIGFRESVAGSLAVATGDDRKAGRKHEADYARDLLRRIPGVAIPENAPRIPAVFPEPDARWRERLPAPVAEKGFFVVHPAAHRGKRSLPAPVWREAARLLREKTGYTPVVVGAEPGAAWPDAVDLRGGLTLAGMADLLARAKLCLSRDSGPAHLAAAAGCPTLCVFMENTPSMGPVRWTPVGPSVRTLVPPPPRAYERIFFDLYRKRATRAFTPEMIAEAAPV